MDEKIIEECERIVEKFKPVGPITVQLIRQNVTGDDYFIEINPRFGGGAPLSMKAGARSAETIFQLLMDRETYVEPVISNGATYSRFDQSVCVQSGIVEHSIKGVIFDLDDTLYNEKEYIKSGYRAIEKYLGISGVESKLWYYFENGVSAIDTYLKDIGRMDLKEKCLKIYREHEPNITLKNGVGKQLKMLRNKGFKIGIITDGRPLGQHNKIKALGLEEFVDDIIITDELGGEQFRKPCDIAFRIMQRKWRIPFEQLVYIGDNIHKDFQAPKQLGMQWILVKNEDSLYQNKIDAQSENDILSILGDLY